MKKKWMSGALALLLAGTTVASMVPAVAVNAEGQDTATGTTYYVDSKSGSDSNDGTSESKAFKTLDKVNALDLEPGDTVLLKKGSVFEDRLCSLQKKTVVLLKHRLRSLLMERETNHRSIQMVMVSGSRTMGLHWTTQTTNGTVQYLPVF